MASLQRLALAATSASISTCNVRGLVNRWRRRLESALVFAAADTVLAAVGRPAPRPATAGAPVPQTAALADVQEISLERELEFLVSAGPGLDAC